MKRYCLGLIHTLGNLLYFVSILYFSGWSSAVAILYFFSFHGDHWLSPGTFWKDLVSRNLLLGKLCTFVSLPNCHWTISNSNHQSVLQNTIVPVCARWSSKHSKALQVNWTRIWKTNFYNIKWGTPIMQFTYFADLAYRFSIMKIAIYMLDSSMNTCSRATTLQSHLSKYHKLSEAKLKI